MAAPPGQVWALVSDITRVGDWGGECVHAEWIDGADGPAVGARFRGHQVQQNRKWTSVSVVIEAQPGVSFAWAVGDPQCAFATWRYQLASDGSGGTILRYRAVMGPGPSGLSDALATAPEREDSIIADRLNEHERNMTATLEAIKQTASKDNARSTHGIQRVPRTGRLCIRARKRPWCLLYPAYRPARPPHASPPASPG